MCLAIPAQIVEFVDQDRFLARVQVSGVRRIVNVALVAGGDDGAEVGDWVLLHVGFAISRIDEHEGAGHTAGAPSAGRDLRAGAGRLALESGVLRRVHRVSGDPPRSASASVGELLERAADRLARACHALARAFARSGTPIACGEGGAATDAAHVAAEFMPSPGVSKLEATRQAPLGLLLAPGKSGRPHRHSSLALGRQGAAPARHRFAGHPRHALRALAEAPQHEPA